MQYLNWIADHPIISIIGLIVILSGLADIIKAFRGC